MQGKLENDEDFGIDGRIQVILLKRNSNDFTISVCWTLCKIRRVYTVSSTHGSEHAWMWRFVSHLVVFCSSKHTAPSADFGANVPSSIVCMSMLSTGRTWICDSVLTGILAARKTGRATYVDVL